jgi:cytochrome P450
MISERENNGASFQKLQSQANLLVIAGIETTATALSGMTYYLCRSRKTYSKLARRIRGAFSSYNDTTDRSTESLPYLKAVIEEGLRIFPPIPTSPPRVSSGETLDGFFVPKGSVVYVSS